MFNNHLKKLTGRDEENVKTITSFQTIKQMTWKFLTEIFYKEAEVGRPAINSRLYDVSKKTYTNLLDYEKPYRPLIINFGSCS